MIKIIGGKYRSRNIDTPSSGTLPSKNMVRGAMISALGAGIHDAHVLDLFAGSGALGIEALSHGARSCDFIDASKEAYQVILKNLATLKESNGHVHLLSYEQFLSSYHGDPYDVVFLDPPYALRESYERAISTLIERNLVSKDVAIVLEYEGEIEVDASRFKEVRDYRYGKTKVRILRGLL